MRKQSCGAARPKHDDERNSVFRRMWFGDLHGFSRRLPARLELRSASDCGKGSVRAQKMPTRVRKSGRSELIHCMFLMVE